MIYIDPNTFCCHTTQNDTGERIPYEDSFFDGKCDAFIEGYRVVPDGATWTRPDGVVFHGLMITPLKDYYELDAAQREYERQLLAEYAEALRILEVKV